VNQHRIKALLWIALITVLFYWRILLGHQFSLLLGYEGANQAYSWFHYWVSSIQQGSWPLWDPFTFGGHPFAGEMQTGAFYPLYLLFVLVPLHHGLFSPQLYHVFFVGTHILGAFFLYLLARELGLEFFAALLAGLCFSLGGFVARLSAWPHLLESAIWLPLLFLFLIRALRAADSLAALSYAALAGVELALSVLAGGLHIVLLEGIAAVTLAAFFAASAKPPRAPHWRRAAVITAVMAVFAAAGGSIQLFASAEYSRMAIRFLGNTSLPASGKIPYAYLNDGMWAHSILGMLISSLPANGGPGEYINPYMGVFPLLLAIIGVWKRWANPWVRYCAGLAAAAFLFALGNMSFLHGLLYAFTPLLWMAREPARAVFLADFAIALLAGFGAEALFSGANAAGWEPLNRIFRWVVAACAAVLGYYVLLGHGDFNPWVSLSILLIIATFGIFRYTLAGRSNAWARFLAISLIAFDLYAFDWSPANVLQEQAKKTDQLQRLMSSRPLAEFLKSQNGIFRVQVMADSAPNLGDLFGVQTTMGAAVTLMPDYERFRRHPDLLNVKYIIRPATAQEPGAVYQDASWKVYENKNAFPRAWVVHNAAVEPDKDKLFQQLDGSSVDFHQTALLGAPPDSPLEPLPAGATEQAEIQQYRANRMQLQVHAACRGLVVLSENDYPGWKALVNGRPAPIVKVDGELRAIAVPAGDSTVVLYYQPAWLWLGVGLCLSSFAGTALLVLWNLRRRKLQG